MRSFLRFFFLILIVSNFQIVAQSSSVHNLSTLLHEIENKPIRDSTAWTEFLEKVWKLQDYRIKDEIDSTLTIKESLIKSNKNKRVQFLYELINSRNFLHKHDYEKTEESIGKAIDFKTYGKNNELIFLNMTGAILNYYIADYVKALEFDFKALELCSRESDKSCLSDIYNNISVVYLMTDNLEKCEEFGMKAYLIADSLDYTKAKSIATQNLAIVFTEKKEYDKAERWYLEDLQIEKASGDSLSISRTLNNLGVLYEKQENYAKAETFYKNALTIAELINDESSIVLGYQNIAWAKFKNGDHRKAEELFNLAIKETKELGNRNRLRDAFKNISEFYADTRRYKKAFDYQGKYISLNDSLVGENHLNAISKLEIQYETQKKENKLLELSKEKQEDELVITQQNRKVRQLSIGIGAITLFGTLGFLLFRQRLQNKKQEELLLAISETQTEERKRIAQDLHDGIGGSLALTKSTFEIAKKQLETPVEAIETALKTLERTTLQVRQISHNLMPGELVRFGLVVAIHTLIENLNQEEINAQFSTNQNKERLEPLKEIQLYRIVQEALQNVLKHARAKNIYIQLNKYKDQLSLMIEDDGQGISTNNPQGMGLKNIKQRVQLLKGIFSVDSVPNRGTVLTIQIPA